MGKMLIRDRSGVSMTQEKRRKMGSIAAKSLAQARARLTALLGARTFLTSRNTSLCK